MKSETSKSIMAGQKLPSDQALLEVIQNNVQRLPVNDNSSSLTRARPRLGALASVSSAVGFVGVMISAIVIMAIARLVPNSQDDHY